MAQSIMLCHQATERIQEYLEQSLTDQKKSDLASHLLDCAACRKTLDDMQQLHQLAIQQPIPQTDSDLVAQVMEKIQMHPETLPQRQPHGSLVALLLLVLGLGYAGLLGWHQWVSRLFFPVNPGSWLQRAVNILDDQTAQLTGMQPSWIWPVLLLLLALTLLWNHRTLSRNSGG